MMRPIEPIEIPRKEEAMARFVEAGARHLAIYTGLTC
jgi:hypothetical protein